MSLDTEIMAFQQFQNSTRRGQNPYSNNEMKKDENKKETKTPQTLKQPAFEEKIDQLALCPRVVLLRFAFRTRFQILKVEHGQLCKRRGWFGVRIGPCRGVVGIWDICIEKVEVCVEHRSFVGCNGYGFLERDKG
jgi:hypothetical protein